jgi:arginine exporter protein ArgO
MTELPFKIFSELLEAWVKGTRRTRIYIGIAGILMGLGIPIFFVAQNFDYDIGARFAKVIGLTLGGTGFLIAFVISALQQVKDKNEKEQKIEAVEKRVLENPKETQAAWELARIVLEKYINRNLAQVSAIFWLTSVVMIAGFSLIGIGSYQAFHDAAHFNASILTSVSGVVVSFIGGTFLILYKSTMAQAKDYVTILERINAVGMSVQILDTLNDGGLDLKHETIADVARQLLTMYSSNHVLGTPPRIRRAKKAAERA